MMTGLAGCAKESSQDASAKEHPLDHRILENTPEFKVFFSAHELNRDEFDNADLKILFVGNSHTRTSPSQLGKLFRLHYPDKRVVIARSVGSFLIQHAESKTTLDLLGFGKWDFVILQGQKYSTSGKYSYPISGTLKLVKLAEDQGSQVILFPEWSRRDVPNEFERINKIHQRIANQTKAKVAPIGQSWKKVADSSPALVLHAPDGNHATEIGHFVNATVFFSMIDQSSAEIESSNNGPQQLDAVRLQNQIAKIAWDQVRQ